VSTHNQKATHELVCDFAKIGQINAITRLSAQIAAFTLSTDSVESLRCTFIQMDKDNSGMICIDEFQSAMQSTGMDEKQVKKLFEDMDIDGTGTIEYSEFISTALLVNNAITKEDLIDAFNKLDTDADGSVNSKELLTVLEDYASVDDAKKMISEMEQHHSAKRDGKVTRAEFMAAVWEKSDVKEMEVASADASEEESS